MIKHLWLSWKPWQLGLLGFSMPWWLACAPTLVDWGWRRINGTGPPSALSNAMQISYLMLLAGFVLAFVALSSDVEGIRGTERLRLVAAMYVFGLCTLPLMIFVALNAP